MRHGLRACPRLNKLRFARFPPFFFFAFDVDDRRLILRGYIYIYIREYIYIYRGRNRMKLINRSVNKRAQGWPYGSRVESFFSRFRRVYEVPFGSFFFFGDRMQRWRRMI